MVQIPAPLTGSAYYRDTILALRKRPEKFANLQIARFFASRAVRRRKVLMRCGNPMLVEHSESWPSAGNKKTLLEEASRSVNGCYFLQDESDEPQEQPEQRETDEESQGNRSCESDHLAGDQESRNGKVRGE